MCNMTWWMWILVGMLVIYAIGFVFVFTFHAFYLQMVTFELALLRSAVWPIWMATGWPRGVPLTMD